MANAINPISSKQSSSGKISVHSTLDTGSGCVQLAYGFDERSDKKDVDMSIIRSLEAFIQQNIDESYSYASGAPSGSSVTMVTITLAEGDLVVNTSSGYSTFAGIPVTVNAGTGSFSSGQSNYTFTIDSQQGRVELKSDSTYLTFFSENGTIVYDL